METPTIEQPCPTKVKTEIDEEPTIPVVPPNDFVNHIKSEKLSDDEDQKCDSDCPPIKKRKFEDVESDLNKEPDKAHQSKQNDSILRCDDDHSPATEKKVDPNDVQLLASGPLGPDKGNYEIKYENSDCIQRCSALTMEAPNQTAVEKGPFLPDIVPNEDKIVQIKSEPENIGENSYIQKTKVNGKRKEEKVKWFRCKSEGCPYKTRFYVVFVRHQLSHKYRSRLKCRYCSFSCKSRAMLTSHLLEHIDAQNKDSAPLEADDSNELNWLSCPVENCSFKTKNCVNFEKHVTYHQRQQLLKCRYCSMPCRGRARMKTHLLRHHSRKSDKGKPSDYEEPQVSSSNSDSENEVYIRAMILKEEICDVNRQKDVINENLNEENNQSAPQDHQDKLTSCDATNQLAQILRLDDAKGEINQNESEVSRTITITIRHSKQSDDSSSLKTALLSGILQSFGMSDEQTNPCQTDVAGEDDKRESHDSVGSAELKNSTVVADILRLFNVSNEEGECSSSSVSRPKQTEVQESQEESGKVESSSSSVSCQKHTEVQESQEESGKGESSSSSVSCQKHTEVQESQEESVKGESSSSSLSLQKHTDAQESQEESDKEESSSSSVSHQKHSEVQQVEEESDKGECSSSSVSLQKHTEVQEESGKGESSCSNVSRQSHTEVQEIQEESGKEESSSLSDSCQKRTEVQEIQEESGKEESSSLSDSCQKHTEIQEIREESWKTDALSAPNEDNVSPESLRENTEISVNEEPQLQPTLSDNQSINDTVEISTTDGKPEELARNDECELQQSTITPNDVQSLSKSNKRKLVNLKQIVIRRVRKSVENSVPAEDTRTSNSSKIPKSGELFVEEITCLDSQCPYKTTSAQDMKVHLHFHEDTGILKCPNCTYGCQNVSDLKEHMNLHIEKSNSMRNNVEISPLTSLTLLGKPNEEDTGQDLEPLIICNPVFSCKFCPTKLNHEQLFKVHLIRHCSTAGIKCPLCTYRSSKTDLLKHLSCHVENIDGMFLCPLCTEKKRNKESMDDHVKVIHSRALFQEHNAACNKTLCNGHC